MFQSSNLFALVDKNSNRAVMLFDSRSFLPNSEQQTIKAEQVFVLYTIILNLGNG